MAKEKMPPEKKYPLIYSIELFVIALIALIIGLLRILDVIPTNSTRLLIYNIVTLVGGAYFFFDFLWAVFSKKRRAKVSMLDKFLSMPISLYLIVFSFLCFFIKDQLSDLFIKLSISIVMFVLCAVSIFMGIYHLKHPVPSILEAIEEAKNSQEEAEKSIESNGNKEN